MSSFIAYDVARLFLGPSSVMPWGIDRIDLAFARHFFSSDVSRTTYGIIPTPWGIQAYPASHVRRGSVIASDIPVHRERADAGVRLPGAHGYMAWLAAVDDMGHGQLPRQVHAVNPALGERAYYEDIVQFIEDRLDAKLGHDRPVLPLQGTSSPNGPEHGNQHLPGVFPRDRSKETVECA